MARHELTREDSAKGGRGRARLVKKQIRAMEKQLGMKIEGDTLLSILEIAKIWVSTPIGQLITGIGVLEVGSKIGAFKIFPGGAVGLAAVIGSVEVIQALGQSGLITQTAGLASSLGKIATSAAAGA